MRDEQVARIRTLLQSGELSDIGGPKQAGPGSKTSTANRTTAALVAAFAAIYLVWGSTYLGIRYAVETIPPLLMMGVRHLIAGALLYGWVRWRGTPAPKLREWLHPVLIGTLLFLGGHGSLAWAEQRVPSGIAALLVATLPMWIVILARVKGTERKLGGRALTGLILGFLGVTVLFGPDAWRHNGELNLIGAGAVLFGTFIWAAGTIYMRSVKMPESPVLSSAMQMLAGGGSLFDVGIYVLNASRYLTGEEPVKFTAVTSTIDQDGRFSTMEENISWTTKFPSGIVATGSSTYGAQMPGYFKVFASKGWLEMGPAFNYDGLKLRASFSSGGRGSLNIEIDDTSPEKDPVQFTREADHFSECVLRNQTPGTPGEEGLRDMEYIEKIYASAG